MSDTIEYGKSYPGSNSGGSNSGHSCVSEADQKMLRGEFMKLAEELDQKAWEEYESLCRSGKPMLDEDGYPTDHACELIEKWHWSYPAEWFDVIKSIWHLRSWGWHEEEGPSEMDPDVTVHRYHISTAGWSGNEQLIRVMEKNINLWDSTWVQSRRGGHYIFEVK